MKIKSKVISCFLAALMVVQAQAIAGMTCHAGQGAQNDHAAHSDHGNHANHGDHDSARHGGEATTSASIEVSAHLGMEPVHQAATGAETCAFCSSFCSMAQALNTHYSSALLETPQSTPFQKSSKDFSSVVLEGLLRPPRS